MAYNICNIVDGLKPALMMVVVQTVFAGVNVFYKLAINDGMSLTVLVAYRYLFAAASLSPLAFFLERKCRPKLTWMIVFQAFLCGLFGGSLAQNLYAASLHLTSATFASAMTNLVPAITFILAIAFRLESLALRTVWGKGKIIGTLIGVGGAMLLTCYKGVEMNIWPTRTLHLHNDHQLSQSHANHVMGSLFALGSCFCYAAWLILQAKLSENYPCHYTSTAMMCAMGAMQAVVYALFMEKDRTQWKLGWNIRLLTVAYSGIMASALMVTLISWCVRLRGPLFVSVFNPLMLVLVAIAGSILLDEKLYLGSIIGSVLIVIGLYMVLWGKAKEEKRMSQLMPSKSSQELSEAVEIIVSSTKDNKISGQHNAAQENDHVNGVESAIRSNTSNAAFDTKEDAAVVNSATSTTSD